MNELSILLMEYLSIYKLLEGLNIIDNKMI